MIGHGPGKLCVLLADDSPSDRRLVAEALAEAGIDHELHEVADGIETLAFLRREGAHAGAPRPDVLLLDLRMPGLTGDEVLEQLYADPDLRSLPVVVQTTSDSDVDLVKVWELGAVHFINKPITAEKLLVALGHEADPAETLRW